MIATIVNACAVLIGSLLGLLLRSRIRDSFKSIVQIGAGVTSLIIGIKMALTGQKIVYLALSLIIGGILGEWWRIEDGILALGETLKRTFRPSGPLQVRESAAAGRGAMAATGSEFGYGFLNASVLFCVGAMALVGSFKAGAEGNYELIYTKSVMDGFMAIVLTAAMGIGVGFSALTVLLYQGILTVAAVWVAPLVNETLLQELTGVGGALVVMIGINLLGIARLKTANFLPALLLIVLFVVGEGWVKGLRLFG
ncbi:MAG: DUF554 domain-containing protein [Spirochaetia bacterium]|jgi:uncharacterized membrane protein YqgA involved in biofilm formation